MQEGTTQEPKGARRGLGSDLLRLFLAALLGVGSVTTWVWRQRTRRRRLALFALLIIVAVVGYTARWLLVAKVDQWQSKRATNAPAKPVVLVVLPATKVAQDLRKGIEDRGEATVRPAGLEYLTEEGSLEDIARKLRDHLMDRSVVLVIGHETSTVAAYMIKNVYEGEDFINSRIQEPIPVILPAATSPLITETPPARGILHVLRLPANDKKQVKAIERFLQSASADTRSGNATERSPTNRQWPSFPRVAILVDNSNPTYSRFFAVSLIADLPESIVDSVGVDIASEGFSSSRFLASRPDIVIFAGMHTQAVIFLRRLLEEYSPADKPKSRLPEILFTDGVVSTFFHDMVTGSVVRAGLADRSLFFTAPVRPEEPMGRPVEFPSYESFGTAAADLAGILISRAAHEGRVDRAAILKQIGLLARNGEQTNLGPDGAITAKFDKNGDNISAEAHVYELHHNHTLHSVRCSCAH